MPLDGFLKIEGIEGECKHSNYKKWINVSGVSWGVSQEVVPAPDGSIAAGTPEVQSFNFTQPYNRASVGLFQACATGRQIPSMQFEAIVPHGDEPFVFLKVLFKDCLVTKINTSSSGAHVSEQVEVVFRSIMIESQERPL
jgi:type VI secretion system secreted protein Hcp